MEEIKVIISGDASGATDALKKVTDEAGKSKESVEKLGGLDAVMDGLSKSLMKNALGFGTLAGAGMAAGDAIARGIKAAVSFIPDAIENTGKLAAQFQFMSLTAGMRDRKTHV